MGRISLGNVQYNFLFTPFTGQPRGRPTQEFPVKRVLLQLLAVVVLVGAAAGAWYWLDAGSGGGGDGAGFGGGQPAPVRVAEARLATVAERIEAVGSTRANESVDLVAQSAGRVTTIHFEEGQRVDAGAPMISLDSERERAERREAAAQREDLRKQLERARQLLASSSVSQARVDELQAAVEAADARVAAIDVRLREREITAPFAGVVGLREVSGGAYVNLGQRITTLDDTAVMRLEFAVPERFMVRLRPGLEVLARSAAFEGETFAGAVRRIDSRVDPGTRSVRVQAEIPNDDGTLRPGMFMTVELTLTEREGVVVPEEAIVSEGARHFVYRIDGDNAERFEIEIGQRQRGQVEVIGPLAPGDHVVISGLQRMHDGAAVRIVDPQAPAADAASAGSGHGS